MKLVHVIEKFERIAICILFSITILGVFAQVVNRNIVQLSIGWFEEIARYSMVYFVLFGTEIGLRDGTQMSLSAVVSRLPKKAASVCSVIARFLTLAFAIFAFVISIELLQMQISSGMVTPGLQIPTFVPFLAIPVGFAFISINQLITFTLSFRKSQNDGEVAQ